MHCSTQTEKILTSMSQVAFEPTIPISHTYQHMHETKLYISLYLHICSSDKWPLSGIYVQRNTYQQCINLLCTILKCTNRRMYKTVDTKYKFVLYVRLLVGVTAHNAQYEYQIHDTLFERQLSRLNEFNFLL
jgi:hypothetical protein